MADDEQRTAERPDGRLDEQLDQQPDEHLDHQPTAESLFRLFDADGDGQITASELAAALAELGEPVDEAEAAARIKGGDADGDGRVSLDEFKAMLRN